MIFTRNFFLFNPAKKESCKKEGRWPAHYIPRICHASGHPKRLNRFDGMSNSFGDIPYSKEELVAEHCSSFLAGIANLDMDIRNSAAYIKGWASALRDNQKWIMWAAARAEKSADYILGNVPTFAPEEKITAEVTSEVRVLEPVLEDFPF